MFDLVFYSPNIRMVNEFGKGRCFLVGGKYNLQLRFSLA